MKMWPVASGPKRPIVWWAVVLAFNCVFGNLVFGNLIFWSFDLGRMR